MLLFVINMVIFLSSKIDMWWAICSKLAGNWQVTCAQKICMSKGVGILCKCSLLTKKVCILRREN